MPNDFLFEAGFWSIPFGALTRDPRDVIGLFREILEQERLPAAKIRLFYSSNRFGFVLEDLPDLQTDVVNEVRGPKSSVAFDMNKHPTPAAIGFAGGLNMDLGELEEKEVDGEMFVFGRKTEKGLPCLEVLPELLEAMLRAVPWSTPAWAPGKHFPHPPLYLCAMVNGQCWNQKLDYMDPSIESGILESGILRRVPVPHAREFHKVLANEGIQATPADRAKVIESFGHAFGGQGATIRMERVIVERIAFEIENPKSFVLDLAPEFLDLPVPLILKCLGSFPAYLPFEGTKGGFLPKCIGFLSGRGLQGDEPVIRIEALRERFEQIRALWETDSRTPFEKRLEELKTLPGTSIRTVSEEMREIAHWAESIASRIDPELSHTMLERLVQWQFSEWPLRLVKKYPDLSGALIPFVAEKQGVAPEITAGLKDLQNVLRSREMVPVTREATCLCLATWFERLHYSSSTAMTTVRNECADRILHLLLSRQISLDVLQLAQQAAKTDLPLRGFWLDALKRRFPKGVGIWFPVLENLPQLDPLYIAKLLKTWPEGLPPDVEILETLQQKLANRLPPASPASPEPPPPQGVHEVSLHEKLTAIDKIGTFEPATLMDHLLQCRLEIEACLMDLPPIVDDQDRQFATRLSLFRTFLQHLERLPFFLNHEKNAILPHPQKEERPTS
jgi:hypothetical protein